MNQHGNKSFYNFCYPLPDLRGTYFCFSSGIIERFLDLHNSNLTHFKPKDSIWLEITNKTRSSCDKSLTFNLELMMIFSFKDVINVKLCLLCFWANLLQYISILVKATQKQSNLPFLSNPHLHVLALFKRRSNIFSFKCNKNANYELYR